VGADADVAIYTRGADGVSFGQPRYVIKSGEVVVDGGDLRPSVEGREFVVRPSYDPAIEEYLRPLFQKVYTMSFDNYPVEMERLTRPDVRAC
jgi:formylmethanofuran dehydrogenase subunit A